MTTQKYFATRNIYRTAPDPKNPGHTIERTAWAIDSKVWPTYMYLAIATISVIMNASVLGAYLKSVKAANKVESVQTWIDRVIMAFNVGIWVVSVAIYRYEKDTGGVSNDLWGWTCSSTAQSLQQTFKTEVPFNTYCTAQASFLSPDPVLHKAT
jgi:hypothetical protein